MWLLEKKMQSRFWLKSLQKTPRREWDNNINLALRRKKFGNM